MSPSRNSRDDKSAGANSGSKNGSTSRADSKKVGLRSQNNGSAQKLFPVRLKPQMRRYLKKAPVTRNVTPNAQKNTVLSPSKKWLKGLGEPPSPMKYTSNKPPKTLRTA